MIFITSDFPGAGLLLSITQIRNFVAKALVLPNSPTSGETQINFFLSNFFYIFGKIGAVYKLSTGISKP